MKLGFARAAIVLGLLAAVGPIAIDLYLPALPQIADSLQTSVGAVQSTFAVYFFALGIAQLIYGPISDWAGRKPPIYAGLAIFVAGSIVCALAADIEWLTAGRFVQAVGAAISMSMPRSITRDLYTGTDATRLIALILLVISVSPMLAPLAGSWISHIAGWRAIFAVLAVAGLLAFLLVALALPETLPIDRRVPIRPKVLLKGCSTLFGDFRFVSLIFIVGFGMASFFVFLASGAFVYMGHYGLSETGFSLVFAVNAIAFFGASQFAAGLGQRYGPDRMVKLATSGFCACYVGLFALLWLGVDHLFVVMICLFLGNGCFGLVLAPASVLSLEEHGDIAGLAASIGGTLQIVTGSVMIWVSQPFFDGTALPMAGVMSLCAVIALALAWMTPPPREAERLQNA